MCATKSLVYLLGYEHSKLRLHIWNRLFQMCIVELTGVCGDVALAYSHIDICICIYIV
jgi:hypothetical protein